MTIVRSTAYVLTTTSMWTHLSQWAQSVCLESTSEPILQKKMLLLERKAPKV